MSMARLIALMAMLLDLLIAGPTFGDTNGAFTESQTRSGQRVYMEHCAQCHGADLRGIGKAPALAGESFRNYCTEQRYTADDLLYQIRAFMPYNEPGKLSKQQYVEVLAYILKMNGFSPGHTELRSDSTVPQRIILESSGPR